jgi:hypothetical protein
MAWANGPKAIAICDQCGFQYLLNELIKDWKGFKVCEECYEPKHPQLEPKRGINEPIALYEPRPQTRQTVRVSFIYGGDSSFFSVGMQPVTIAPPLVIAGAAGRVTVAIT